ncbi:hypothetical protein JRQ81_014769 [Phrynocephalus forsythii]|uniref:Uncharacterized protein n=1 Tax=Phrynocephalus forsythii TaxID=171643 RepID=A0A9Q0XXB4_9SAUR|nr:hypothetical protein JRQ81_014769 [Phrynocephalus forsythii]
MLCSFQLGENDHPAHKNVDLTLSMEDDLTILHLGIPGAMLMWSDMLKRQVWCGALNPGKVDLAQRKVIQAGGHTVTGSTGMWIHHWDIVHSDADFFWNGGVYPFRSYSLQT